MSFEKIIGHKSLISHLTSTLSNRTLPHALLFSGPSGIGKRTLARSLATVLLSTNTALVNSGNHPDLHFVNPEEGKKDITVDSIRELISSLHLKPYLSKSTVAIIDNAHQMNIAASNALLMTLEEPTNNCYIILVTDASHRLPETIVSRCQVFHFGLLSKDEINQVIDNLFDPILEHKNQLNTLKTICAGSISALQIDRFINNKTLKLENLEELKSHISELISEIQKYQEKFDSLLDQKPNSKFIFAQALSIASDYASSQQIDPLFWQTLRTAIRNRLRQAKLDSTTYYAELLLDTLKTQQNISERNLSAQLQVCSLMLRTKYEQPFN